MKVLPAIDIKDGSTVRLFQGNPNVETIYSLKPTEAARQWVDQGATELHVVDLDGALNQGKNNLDAALEVQRAVSVPVQFGGGVRDEATVRRLLSGGMGKVVIGTALFKNPGWVAPVLKEFPGKLVAGLDVKDDEVMVEGWRAGSGRALPEMVKFVEDLGFEEVIFTDIRRDGALRGPNLAAVERLLGLTQLGVYASGGVTGLGDIKELSRFAVRGLRGCIVGKALYDGRITLADALAAANGTAV
jgi:phosphoribosylformimino-5-aminoimidazole carboxamide ribotide isomerase